MRGELTAKQKRFIEAYDGNATHAAASAGYSAKSAERIGRDLLRIPPIAKAIRERENKAIKPLIANRQKRQEFWTSVMNDAGGKIADRLKASELLGKSEGDFLERMELSGEVGNRRVTPEEAAEAMQRRIAENKARYEAE